MDNMNKIIQFVRIAMYFVVGILIMILPIPLFKNAPLGFKIGMGVLFILYAGFRIYQLIQRNKTKPDHEN